MKSKPARPQADAEPFAPARFVPIALDLLEAAPVCGYRRGAEPAAEPTAIAALALSAHGRSAAARKALAALAAWQRDDGRIAPLPETEPLQLAQPASEQPGWPTAWAILAWTAVARGDGPNSEREYASPLARALAWLMADEGSAMPRTPDMGHDSTIVGWPWVTGTHSWLEPTALAVWALKLAGRGDSPRVREGVRLIVDRILPGGGWNYGNTIVLGQKLRPHGQPTALALLSLAGETNSSESTAERIRLSLSYLRGEVARTNATATLALSQMAFRALDESMDESRPRLARAAERQLTGEGAPYPLALAALAEAPDLATLWPLPATSPQEANA